MKPLRPEGGSGTILSDQERLENARAGLFSNQGEMKAKTRACLGKLGWQMLPHSTQKARTTGVKLDQTARGSSYLVRGDSDILYCILLSRAKEEKRLKWQSDEGLRRKMWCIHILRGKLSSQKRLTKPSFAT